MDIKSLMVEDWVYNKHHRKNIRLTPYDFFTHTHDEFGGQRLVPCATPTIGLDLEPIPLTPEILEKNGFLANRHIYPYPYYEYEVKEFRVGFAFPQGDKTSYKEPWVYIDSERVFAEHLPCVFVHQLQQILRICGISKEIEL